MPRRTIISREHLPRARSRGRVPLLDAAELQLVAAARGVDAAGDVFVLGEPFNLSQRPRVRENDFVTLKYSGATGQ